MTRRRLLIAIAITVATVLRPQAETQPDGVTARLDAHMTSLANQQLFSGTVLVARDGRVLLNKGYGMANYEWDVPNTPRTKFRLGSITKQFTAMAILQLEEHGKLSVSDPITKHLADYPRVGDTITIEHLLTHTSGIPSYTDGLDYREHMRVWYTTDQMIDRFKNKPLEFNPGEKFKYDNSGYFLLGGIIERVSGMTYESYLRANIFEPLGMSDSGYDHTQTLIKHRASGYDWLPPATLRNTEYLDMGQPYAAGSLFSTVEDLYKWDQALYTEKLVTRATLEKMFMARVDAGDAGKYAFGWFVRTLQNRKAVVHGGGINGFATNILRFHEDHAVIIWLKNVLRRDGPPALQNDLAAILFAGS